MITSGLNWAFDFPCSLAAELKQQNKDCKVDTYEWMFLGKDKNTLQFNSILTWIWCFDYTEMSSDAKHSLFPFFSLGDLYCMSEDITTGLTCK